MFQTVLRRLAARVAAAGAASAALAFSGAALGQAGAPGPLTIYSGQHEALTQLLADAFTAETGVAVTLRVGKDAEMANQLIEEGQRSPADVLLTEEPGPIAMLDLRGLLEPVDAATLAQVDERLVPGSGNWLPYAARARVIFYNPELISVSELPRSILDLTDPKWKGRFAYAPSGAFASTVTYLVAEIGRDATLEWLKGIKANGINEGKNGKVRDTVEAGQHPFGLSNHYYWWILANSRGGPDKLTSRIYYFDHPDAGGLLLTSGAAVLKASGRKAEAQRFLAWLASPDGGQGVIAAYDAAPQFPTAPGVDSLADLPKVSELPLPAVDADVFADLTTAMDLILEAGIY